MMVSNPGDVPEYELNPSELQFKKGDEVVKVKTLCPNCVPVKLVEETL